MREVARRVQANVAWLDAALREIDGIDIVTPVGTSRRAGILTFRHRAVDGAALHAALMDRRVICSARCGGVRLAPHFYTSEKVLQESIYHISQIIRNINNG